MNKELIYIGRALLMILVLFIFIKVLNFSLTADKNFTTKSAASIDINTAAPVPDAEFYEGKDLFKKNCTSCHPVNKIVDGPRLEGVTQRVDRELIYAWIRNSDQVLKSGNEYFNNLYKEIGSMMPSFSNLTNKQIDAILKYIETHQNFPAE